MMRCRPIGIICLAAICLAVTAGGVDSAYCSSKQKSGKPSTAWVTKSVGNLTLSIPGNWKTPKILAIKTAGWYIGADESKPEAAFAYIWDKAPLQTLLNTCSIKKKTAVKVGGVCATEYRVKSQIAEFDGLIIAGDKIESDGSRLLIVAAADVNKWAKYGPTLRKIIASIKIKE